jgi:hypothetical protein
MNLTDTSPVNLEFDQSMHADESGDETARYLSRIREARSVNAQRMRERHNAGEFVGMQTYADMLDAAERCLPRLWLDVQGETETPLSFGV